MTRLKGLKIVNPVLAVIFLIQASTGIFHDTIPYEMFRSIHGICGILLVLFVAIHVGLNWAWIKNNMFRRRK